MRKERAVSCGLGALLGILSSYGSMGALATGMRFEEVSLKTVLLVCVLGSVLFGLLAGRKLFPALPAVILLGSLWLWREGTLEWAAEAFLHQISTLYDMGYGWGVIRWLETPPEPAEATLVFCLLGLLVSMAVTWAVVRGKSVWLAVPLVFLPLVPCLVLTDTVPATGFVFLQLLSVLLLLFSQSVRRRSSHQGNKLLLILTLPVTAALLLLFFLIPKEGYQGQKYAQDMEDFFVKLFQIAPQGELPGVITDIPMDSSGRILLTNVGTKASLRFPVMSVTAEETGLMYLRGTAYDYYRGTYWDEDDIDYRFEFYSHGAETKSVTISTRSIRDYLYVPYAPQSILVDGRAAVPSVRGKVENEDNVREYTVRYSPVTDTANLSGSAQLFAPIKEQENDQWVIVGQEPVSNPQMERYLQLNQATKEEAQALLARELPQLAGMNNDWQKALVIAEFVRNSAVYDLDTRRMPSGSNDFALWFLEESDTGYCVHFATATAVLLRAAGVPCRYVTGYLARTQAGETVSVLQKNAHAWVEVLVYGQGWVVLEATPGGGVESTASSDVIQETEAPTTPDSSQPTDPEEPTNPDSPEKPTAPENPTDPDMPTEPGATKPNAGTEPGMEHPEETPFVLPGWIKVLLWIGAVILGVILQWKLRVALRQRRHKHGGNNERVLAMWRDIERCARLLKTQPEENLLELARKARFSQYRLTKDEVAAMAFGLGNLRRTLWREPFLKRLYAQLILALY